METWIALAPFAAQLPTGLTPPDVSSFVPIPSRGQYGSQRVEVRIGTIIAAGTNNTIPSSVTFNIWRRYDGRADRIGVVTVSSTDYAAPLTSIHKIRGGEVAVTVEAINGGQTPKVTCAIEARPI